MNREILENIIEDFNPEKFVHFFRSKNRAFAPKREELNQYGDDNLRNGVKLGEIDFSGNEQMIICAFETTQDLTERSGKKIQYKEGKKILKERQYDAGIFIFYDQKGNFRFSLIYANYSGTRRDWSEFRRFTYFVSKELTNKTFLERIGEGDFSFLDKIKESFSVEPVTRQFYNELQNWYFWAMDKVQFPKDFKYSADSKKDEELRNSINLIRLITRIIFIWFIRQRGIIPDVLFDKHLQKTIVKDFCRNNKSANYYNAILQNLFFGTLNQKMDERKFANENGYPAHKKEFGVKTLYRYSDKFLIAKEEAIKLLKNIPFLNGGLFDCLDKEDETGRLIYIDGFSRNPQKQAIIPDYLFFEEKEEKVDLSDYGLGVNKSVKGLFEILNNYNFTIDENTPIDQEVALDPELLGKVFENLLASYNPETATTARKATGSYYTPREIVDYMVEESLIAYLSNAGIFDSTANILVGGNIPADENTENNYPFLNPYNEIKIHQGNLPHWQQKDVFYFVTFRLADSIPKEKVEQLRQGREIWLKNHPKNKEGKYSTEELREYYRLFSERVEKWLDEGAGSCILKEEKYAKIVANALLYFNNDRYILDEWVIMPNHTHVLVKPINNYSLTEILHSWKSYTANEINKHTGEKGQLWMHESYDHIVRNREAFEAIRNYIRQNPAKAGITLPDSAKSTASIPAGGRTRSKDAPATMRLRHLLSYTDEPHMFSEAEAKKIITAINNIKILDPACGSGAFPMGMLHKLVNILHKLDTDNKVWYEIQYQKAIAETEVAFRIGKKEDREQRLKEINEVFDQNINEPDYARKLYLIENCIYGVDIQPIAVQISKLRFFISLVIDQKVNKQKPNCGILSLPNLETKFVAANTLIGLDKPRQLTFKNPEIAKKEEELKQIRHKYFEAKTRKEKLDYQKKDQQIRREIADLLKHGGWDTSTAEKIAKFDLYDQNASADFFDPEWMFGVTNGFDVVIANPPYIRHESIKAFKPQLASEFDSFYCGTADLYTYFYKKGVDLLRKGGHLCFIAPNKFMRAGYGRNTRTLLAKEVTPKIVIDFCDLPIFDATIYPAVILVEKRSSAEARLSVLQQPVFLAATFTDAAQLEHLEETLSSIGFRMPVSALKEEGWNLERPEVLALMEKLRKAGKPLSEYVQGKFYYGIKTGLNDAFVIDAETRKRMIAADSKSEELIKPWLRGRDIKKWKAEWAGLYLLYIPWHFKIEIYPAILKHLQSYQESLENRNESERGRYEWYALQRYASDYHQEFSKLKIVWGNLATEPKFAFDSTGSYISAPANIIPTDDLYLLSILNTPLCRWWISLQAAIRSGGFLEYKPMYVGTVPITTVNDKQKAPIIERVRKILANPSSSDVPSIETEIARLVYELYDLTPEEIAIVEGKG